MNWEKINLNLLSSNVLVAVMEASLKGVFLIRPFRHYRGLLTSLTDRWRWEIRTYLSFGKATITLDDVYYIVGLLTVEDLVVHNYGSPFNECEHIHGFH